MELFSGHYLSHINWLPEYTVLWFGRHGAMLLHAMRRAVWTPFLSHVIDNAILNLIFNSHGTLGEAVYGNAQGCLWERLVSLARYKSTVKTGLNAMPHA